VPTVTPAQAEFILCRLFQAARERGPFPNWEQLVREVFKPDQLQPETATAVGSMTVQDLALLACQEGPARR
jgi:hypothetical protein